MKIRVIEEKDAEEFLNLSKQLDQETSFMLFEPEERKTTVEQQELFIQRVLTEKTSTIFVCESSAQLVGFLGVFGGGVKRKSHSAYIVIGILQNFTGNGLGVKLFTEMEAWAKDKGIHRLELTAMTHNVAGLSLYKKMGFTIEGTKQHSLIINGEYIDEYYMAKLLH